MKENNILEKYKRIGIISIIIILVCMVAAIMKITDKEVLIFSLCILVLGLFAILFSVILLNWRKGLIKSIETEKNITNVTEEEKKEYTDTIISYEKSLRQITVMSAIHLVAVVVLTIFLFI
ncbi:hypothetical protein AZF37_04400 [endosymbiont 'TC1' of Trimyema compressum]|uniref:hypothetical protein n=1 Tax=endosymbiont 'TC1' of Trimyema compressum TaxID=243899 RepID=UPI0007F09168|nr:hypothetical protein [endosymbiont 'TC1' of Trimyema compressum]AMP20509.1 hypothetical protein AZF37_04400 [endosymbiont 'TC1' of Trimyema compressum]